jgi:glycerophosphoryl diester phosphodiesterase
MATGRRLRGRFHPRNVGGARASVNHAARGPQDTVYDGRMPPRYRPSRAFLEGLRPTLHIAHRGGSLVAPENTLEAFRLACGAYRTDMIELDVHLTRDGALVVAHDPDVDRCTDGAGPIAGMTLDELRRLDAGYRFSADGGATFPFRARGVRIPTLREVLDACPTVRVNLELKPEAEGAELRLVEELLDSSRRGGTRELDRVCLGSADDAVAERLHRAAPDACHFFPTNALTKLVLALKSGASPGEVAALAEDDRFSVFDMPASFQGFPLVDRAFVDAAAELGKWINVWTIDDRAEMEALVELGVGGIMTDRPDVLREVLDARTRS